MKSIKLGILGVCIALVGLGFATNNFIAICGTVLGAIVALAALAMENDQS